MLGTIVNSIAIIGGAILGVRLKDGIKEDYKNTIMDGISLSVIVIGISSGIKSEDIILVIGSIVLGSLIGEIIGIENRLGRLGSKLGEKFDKEDSSFVEGFITGSLVYCIGAMAIIGSLEAGLLNHYETLYVKSILDGITSIIFASTLGIGVAFASIPVFLYQGIITLLAFYLKDILIDSVILEMTAIGGILITAIGINLLNIRDIKIKIGNMLPAIFIPIIYQLFINIFNLAR